MLNKRSNVYAQALGLDFYWKTPKAVFAAVAASYASTGGDHLEAAQANVLREWWALYDNGLVPQKPPFPRPVED